MRACVREFACVLVCVFACICLSVYLGVCLGGVDRVRWCARVCVRVSLSVCMYIVLPVSLCVFERACVGCVSLRVLGGASGSEGQGERGGALQIVSWR